MEILKINNLDFSYKEKIVFTNLSINITAFGIYSILGSNSSGKTTLAKIISGIISTENLITAVDITLNKKTVNNYLKNLGIILDCKHSFLEKTVMKELSYPLKNLNYKKKNIKLTINNILNYFELEYLKNKKISALTIEEKYYLILMISLIHNPKLLIFDDFLSNFTKFTKEKLIKKLTKYLKENNTTLINLTSSLEDTFFSDYVYILAKGKLKEKYTKESMIKHLTYIENQDIAIPFPLKFSSLLKKKNKIDRIYKSLTDLKRALWK